MFGSNKNRTPKQKAERAQLGIVARLAGCGYLIYIMVKILRTPSDTTPPVFKTVIAIVMLVLSIFVIILTLKEFVRGLKIGRYKASTYEEEDLQEYLKRKAAESGTADDDAELIGKSGGDTDDGKNEEGKGVDDTSSREDTLQ